MSLRIDGGIITPQRKEIEPKKIAAQQPTVPQTVPAADNRVGENSLFGMLRKNTVQQAAVAMNFLPQMPVPTDVDAPAATNPPTPYEALEQIKNLPVPNADDTAAVRTYNQQRAEIADRAVQNAVPPSREDYSSLPGRLADYEYREALSYYNSSISELEDIRMRAVASPNELPIDAPLAPYAALERIDQIPVPDPSDAGALDQYIEQTRTIAEASLELAQPPKRSDFNGLPPRLANMEYQDALSAYNSAVSELQPFADGVSYVRYDATVDFMYEEMMTNLDSEEFKFIKDNLDLISDPPLFSDPNASTGYLTAALTKFYDQVKTGGPWDHKPILEDMLGLEEGVDLRFPVRGDAEHEVFYDVWSNIHYGYIGTAAGFGEGELQKAADIAEEGTGKNDPADKLTIQIGIDLWNKYGENMTQEQFEAEVQAQIPDLIAAQETSEYTDKNGDFQHVSDINEGNRR
jgi:hypothetical protein